jgi:myo-inositol-1(or 4)-monophosphatase
MIDYKLVCEEVCRIARDAGQFIKNERRNFSADKIEEKGDQNLVSYVDRQAEELIVRRLRSVVPEAEFLTEEHTVECSESPEGLCWIIDPLDGTTNFIHDIAPYCVSIALMNKQKVVVGVIYEIVSGEMFYAWEGSAAYLDGKEIRVSKVDSLKNSLIAHGFAYNMHDYIDTFLRQMKFFQLNTNGVRRMGSAAANLAYVACGRFDAFSQRNLSPWDVAAGTLIVERAGGVVTDMSGGTNFVFGHQIIATNEMIASEFRKAIGDII